MACLSAAVPADDQPPLTSDMQPISTCMEPRGNRTTGAHRKTSRDGEMADRPGHDGTGSVWLAVHARSVPQGGHRHEICRLAGAPGTYLMGRLLRVFSSLHQQNE